MRTAERFKLRFAKYRTPKFRYGSIVACAVRGPLRIVGLTNGRIPWPIGYPPDKSGGRASLVVYKGLAKAVRVEASQAVQRWWGVGHATVWKWRRALDAPANTKGTSALRKLYGQEDWFQAAQRKAVSMANSPERRKKIAAAKRGKKLPKHLVAAMAQRQLGKTASPDTRKKMSKTHKALGTRPPWLKPAWQPWEDELVRTLSTADAAGQTGRTISAVRNRRHALGVPDGRAHRA